MGKKEQLQGTLSNQRIKKQLPAVLQCKLAGCDKAARVSFCSDAHRQRDHNIKQYIKSIQPPKNFL